MKNYKKFKESVLIKKHQIRIIICAEELDYLIKSKKLFARKLYNL